ncbi:hypothetical protein C9374_005038 [Naegleria lovaniensis]|uniref:L-2-hydroxyglutarate dehydrogenase, mitochondrial n=1 Tax=Naegleria lovaniensis TaxID=51637 RepID=A0AA88KK15_NAELO|nr:uncharacterized protein C9374_005038 [Naegleria lovaniensis]KAG2382458.1 hypothetical protein C9374_005038 [Naegleria lovaniensis]
MKKHLSTVYRKDSMLKSFCFHPSLINASYSFARLFRSELSQTRTERRGANNNEISSSATIIPNIETLRVKNLIIGAGVVGVACGARLSMENTKKHEFNDDCIHTLVVERNEHIGQEISSRNSEVIHAGLYYESQSLKTKLCVLGNSLIYSFCERMQVPHARIGKWIVANSQHLDQVQYLQNMKQKTDQIIDQYHAQVKKLQFLSSKEIRTKEPILSCDVVLFSESTGIIDTHTFMSRLSDIIVNNGGQVVTNTKVNRIYRNSFDEYLVEANCLNRDGTIDRVNIITETIVNSAGLDCERITQLAYSEFMGEHSILPEHYHLHYFKGHYFKNNNRTFKVNRLIYPVPPDSKGLSHGLGIHATLDLDGNLKFGPDSDYIGKARTLFPEQYLPSNVIERDTLSTLLYPHYKIESTITSQKREIFYQSISKYLNGIDKENLQPDYVGIRPKLQKPGDKFKDFIIEPLGAILPDKTEGSLASRFISLCGIESPGLTSSLAIANYVANDLLNYSSKCNFK